jgi:hypothetical protein
VILEFEGEAIEWRGPAPFVFVATPPEIAADIKSISSMVTYGWGCIPVKARIGKTNYTTSLFPKNGTYLVPIKVVVQQAENINVGNLVSIELVLDLQTL